MQNLLLDDINEEDTGACRIFGRRFLGWFEMGFITNAVRFSARFLFYLDVEYELQNWITIKVSLRGFVIQENYQIKQPWQ